jgi:hypothetical protein
MSSPHAEFFPSGQSNRATRAVRWLLPAALLALTPKCLLCLAAYAGFGTALGLGGPEMCGASAGSAASWGSSLAGLGGALGGIAFLARKTRTTPS